jgi:hypothetical protein
MPVRTGTWKWTNKTGTGVVIQGDPSAIQLSAVTKGNGAALVTLSADTLQAVRVQEISVTGHLFQGLGGNEPGVSILLKCSGNLPDSGTLVLNVYQDDLQVVTPSDIGIT